MSTDYRVGRSGKNSCQQIDQDGLGACIEDSYCQKTSLLELTAENPSQQTGRSSCSAKNINQTSGYVSANFLHYIVFSTK